MDPLLGKFSLKLMQCSIYSIIILYPLYFEDIALYFEDIALYFEDIALYFEYIALYFEYIHYK